MLRFKLGRIPVHVHFSHVAISLLLAFSFAQSIGPHFPLEALGAGLPLGAWATGGPHGLSQGMTIALWGVMVTGSVLVHELGHATVARRLGYPASVHLFGLGGLTRAEGTEWMPWHQDVLFTLAGPAAGLSLGLTAGLLRLGVEAAGVSVPALRYVLEGLLFANVFWTLLNLAPVATLDGGRVVSAVFTRLWGRAGFLLAQLASLLIAVGLVAFAMAIQQWFLALLFGLLVVRTVANLAAWQRGELPLGPSAHPAVPMLQQAEQSFMAGQLAEAERTARQALSDATPAGLRSRAHLVLGWVALKRGEGRQALDHFALVRGFPVPPHALAAGFSLVGDEVRAVPLWAEAAKQSRDDTILHEYAGALLRAGREAEARRLVGVKPALAYLAAERVHSVRGEHAQAAAMAEASFREQPSPTVAYSAACDWAQAGNAAAALRMLTVASQAGFDARAQAMSDSDLSSLRALPEFQSWLDTLPATPGHRPSAETDSSPMTKA